MVAMTPEGAEQKSKILDTSQGDFPCQQMEASLLALDKDCASLLWKVKPR